VPGPNSFPVVLVAASAGGFQAVSTIVKALPADLPAAVVILVHRSPNRRSVLGRLLARQSKLPVVDAANGQRIEPGVVYIARPDRHLLIGADRRFSYRDGARIKHLRSSANPMFESGARELGADAIAVVLTGSGTDGTDGVQDIRRHGGTVIAQDEATSAHFGMPGSAIETGAVDYVKPLLDIAPTLIELIAEHHRRTLLSAL